MAHILAGKPVQPQDIMDVEALVEAYYSLRPDAGQPSQCVSFGTSGHRGVSVKGTFNDLHVAAITQAICDGRQRFGATSLCFVGQDTHALSQPALQTVLEVLAANGVVAAVDANDEFVPTPSVSRAILRHNAMSEAKADGIIITPSHNPPDNGGIKYNPPHGGPAEGDITSWIEERANAYVRENGAGIRRMERKSIPENMIQPYEFKMLYVKELVNIIDMDVLKAKAPRVLVNALGGSGSTYWEAIRDYYELPLTVIHSQYDPTFKFMTYDHDGVIRMDCSSAYAMADVIQSVGDYDLAVGNDPDYDRYGIVTKEGLLPANHYLVTAGKYLFETRDWPTAGFGKTVCVTSLVDRYCKDVQRTVYEVPVGFKFLAPLLYTGTVGIGGEESAGASFLQRNGSVWTTDKDGMIMALLAMEMMARTGKTPAALYAEITAAYGAPVFSRKDAPCSGEAKKKLKQLKASDVKDTTLAGEAITSIRTTALHDDLAIGGVRIETANSWVVARPSGTEDLYKIYGETFQGDAALGELLEAGQRLVDSVTK